MEHATPVSLDQLVPGESGRIRRVGGEGAVRRRLVDMGLTQGTVIEMIKISPLGDPIEYRVRDYYLSLRASEAKTIQVELQGRAHPAGRGWHGRGFNRTWRHSNGWGTALPLARCSSGQKAVITGARGGRRFTGRLADLGLVPGADIQVIGNDFPGPIIIALDDGSRLTLGRGMAWHILVKPS